MTATPELFQTILVRLPRSGRVYRYKAPIDVRYRPGLDAVRVPTPDGPEIADVVAVDDEPILDRPLKWVEVSRDR